MRRTIAVLALLTAASGVAWMPAASASGSRAVCTFSEYVNFNPGVTLQTRTSSYTATTGNLSCVGTINGESVTGPGAYTEVGSITGNCLQGSGPGQFFLTVPSGTQKVHLTGTYDLVYVAGQGSEVGPMIADTFQSILNPVDCLTARGVTQIFLIQQEVIQT